MSKQPRVNIDAWVGPLTTQPPQPPGGGQLMAQMGTLIFANKDAELQAYVVANKAALGDITGAYIQSIRDAGYTVDNNGNITPGAPSFPVEVQPVWTVTESRRRVNFVPGTMYVFPFVAPLPPSSSAAPDPMRIAGSISPAGSGSLVGYIQTQIDTFQYPPGTPTGAGGVADESVPWNADTQGKTFYWCTALGQDQYQTDVNTDMILPQPVLRP